MAMAAAWPATRTFFLAATNNPNFFNGLGEPNYTLAGTPVSAGGCTYTINPGGRAFSASGGNGSIAITAGAGCNWTAASTASWITITGGSSGTGNGNVTCQVVANSGAAQSAPINITAATGNLSFTVEEGAASIAAYTNKGSMAHLAVAGSWTTIYTLANTGSAAAQMRLSFFDSNGNPLALPLTFPQSPNGVGALLASTLDRTINPGAELIIQSTGVVSAPITVGSAQLLTNGSISGFARFSTAFAASIQDAVVPLETRNASGYVVPYENTNGSATGIALANITAQPVPVTINYRIGGSAGYSGDGVLDNTETLVVPPMGHMSFNLADRLKDTAGEVGTVEFLTPSAGQISLLGLLFNSTGAFSTLPALVKSGN